VTSHRIDVDSLLDRHRERFRRLLRAIVAEEEGQDPFAVSLDDYLRLSEDERFELVRRATAIAWDRVERELTSHRLAWLVLVGNDIVASSDDPASIPTPAGVLAYGRDKGLVGYLFTADLIEELPSTADWVPIRGADRYPTLPMAIERDGDFYAVTADLDTGSHVTVIDRDLLRNEPETWLAGRHLGQPFFWSPVRARLRVATTGGSALDEALPAWQVRDWSSSPFVRINPSRRVLAGRDLLRAFGLHVVLRASDGRSEIAGSG
jgi:hypothetical protein